MITFIGTLEVIDSPMTTFWSKWVEETKKKGFLSIGWRFTGNEDTLPFTRCEIADLVTPGVHYAFCLKVNTTSNRTTDFTVETSILGDEIPLRKEGHLFYPEDSRGSLMPIPTSEYAWVLPMSPGVANAHIWMYTLAVFHGDDKLADSLVPIIKVSIFSPF